MTDSNRLDLFPFTVRRTVELPSGLDASLLGLAPGERLISYSVTLPTSSLEERMHVVRDLLNQVERQLLDVSRMTDERVMFNLSVDNSG